MRGITVNKKKIEGNADDTKRYEEVKEKKKKTKSKIVPQNQQPFVFQKQWHSRKFPSQNKAAEPGNKRRSRNSYTEGKKKKKPDTIRSEEEEKKKQKKKKTTWHGSD